MPKPKKQKRKSWWQKQSSAMKTTVVAGVFGLIVALCGVCGTITTTVIEHSLSQERIKVNVAMSANREIMGRGDMLFARKSQNYADDFYELSTGTCIEAKRVAWPDNSWVSINAPQDLPKFSDVLFISFETNLSIIIESIELRLVEFTPINPKDSFDVYYAFTGRFGGGGWTKQVELETIELTPRTENYYIFHEQKYQLPENDSVIFYIPFVSYTPGIYTFQTIAHVGTYDTTAQEIVSPENITLKWVDIRNVDINTIQDPEDMEFRICP